MRIWPTTTHFSHLATGLPVAAHARACIHNTHQVHCNWLRLGSRLRFVDVDVKVETKSAAQ
jgi:hypothetical protein